MKNSHLKIIIVFVFCLFCTSCTIKAVGDPKRPITIEAHITVDVRGLKDTATNIEDFVSGKTTAESLPVKQ